MEGVKSGGALTAHWKTVISNVDFNHTAESQYGVMLTVVLPPEYDVCFIYRESALSSQHSLVRLPLKHSSRAHGVTNSQSESINYCSMSGEAVAAVKQ
jgi:hypothetical protein